MKGQAAQAEKDSNEETVPSNLQIVGDNSAGTRQFPVLELCACRSFTGLSKYGNFRKKIPQNLATLALFSPQKSFI
jgi:hypothetical protein